MYQSLLVSDKLQSKQKTEHDLKIFLYSNNYNSDSFDICLEDFIKENRISLINNLNNLIKNYSNIKHKDQSLHTFLELHENLNLFDINLINEKCNFDKSKYFNDLLIFMALDEILTDKGVTKLVIDIEDLHMNRIISNYRNYFFKSKTSNLSNAKFYITNFKHIFFGIFSFFLNIAIMIPFLPSVPNRVNISASRFHFFSYLSAKNNLPDANNINENYWEGIQESLNGSNKSSVWFYHLQDKKFVFRNLGFFRFSKNIKNNKNSYYLIYEYINLNVLLIKLRKLFQFITILRKKNQYFWMMLNDDFISSIIGKEAVTNILNSLLIKEIYDNDIYSKNIFYLQENQSWEKLLVANTKKLNSLYGFPHTVIRDWDLRFHSYNENKKYLPQNIIANGEDALKKLSKYYSSNIIAAESLRHNYLYDMINNKTKRHKDSKKIKSIILLTEYSKASTNNALRIVDNAIDGDIKVDIKPHPNYLPNLDNFKNFSKIITDKKLYEIYKNYDLAIVTCQTSMSLECHLLQIPFLIIKNADLINLNPLSNYKNIEYCRFSNEIKEYINSSYDEELKTNVSENFIYINPNLTNWKKILRI
jgi:surface carbohydrate biosynthesis protein (TIGR04326 family)